MKGDSPRRNRRKALSMPDKEQNLNKVHLLSRASDAAWNYAERTHCQIEKPCVSLMLERVLTGKSTFYKYCMLLARHVGTAPGRHTLIKTRWFEFDPQKAASSDTGKGTG